VVYGMTTVGAAIAAQDHVQLLWPSFVYPFRATMADRMGPFRHYIPEWMVPQDPGVVESFYLGRENFLRPEILAAWIVPIASWFVWLVARRKRHTGVLAVRSSGSLPRLPIKCTLLMPIAPLRLSAALLRRWRRL
jgi:hypothetical protein